MIAGLPRRYSRPRRSTDLNYLHSRFPTVADRLAESAKLHTRGGFARPLRRQPHHHARGDKIEVVQGNYQLIVLGRHDKRSDGGRIEASGGHPVGDCETETPGAVMEVRFEPDKYETAPGRSSPRR